jgi:transposase
LRAGHYRQYLARESLVRAGPCTCPACGGALRRIGEDVTESLDYVPGQFKVVRHVREAFACRACEQVVQAPAPTMPFLANGPVPDCSPTSR